MDNRNRPGCALAGCLEGCMPIIGVIIAFIVFIWAIKFVWYLV